METWLAVTVFTALSLMLSLYALTASGHFPRDCRSPGLRGAAGLLILFGSLLAAVAALIIGLAAGLRSIPWFAMIIGGGSAILLAPLCLTALSDGFVNSRCALVSFCSAALLLGLILLSIA